MNIPLLIVDDDIELTAEISRFLSRQTFTVQSANTLQQARQMLAEEIPEILLLDLKLPDGEGFELLEEIRQRQLDVVTIILSGYGTIPRAVEAIKEGAEDFLTKPIDPEHLSIVLNRVLQNRNIRYQFKAQKLQIADHLQMLITSSTRIQKVLNTARKVAQTNSTVLISGETGTGKQLLAYYIHQQSPRKDSPFVYVNCANLSENLIESDLFGHEKGAFTGAIKPKIGRVQLANTGTLFLDEIGELPLTIQSKLLHFIEYGEFQRVGDVRTYRSNVRVICATNRDLSQAVANGTFREDLFYRIQVVSIEIPPLRERPEDIPHFIAYFLEKFSRELGKLLPKISSEVLQQLQAYPWPGNIRELKNAIERAMVLSNSPRLTEKDFPFLKLEPEVSGTTDQRLQPLSVALRQYKRQYVLKVLKFCGNNQTRAARLLNIQRSYLNQMLREWQGESDSK